MHSTDANSAPTPTYQVTTRHVLVVLLGAFAALGFFSTYLDAAGIPEPRIMQLASTFMFSLLTFTWFWLDSEARGYKRSPFLNISIVAFGALAIPYYLVRSRPQGQRLKAVGKCLGFALLLVLAFAVGGAPALFL